MEIGPKFQTLCRIEQFQDSSIQQPFDCGSEKLSKSAEFYILGYETYVSIRHNVKQSLVPILEKPQ